MKFFIFIKFSVYKFPIFTHLTHKLSTYLYTLFINFLKNQPFMREALVRQLRCSQRNGAETDGGFYLSVFLTVDIDSNLSSV